MQEELLGSLITIHTSSYTLSPHYPVFHHPRFQSFVYRRISALPIAHLLLVFGVLLLLHVQVAVASQWHNSEEDRVTESLSGSLQSETRQSISAETFPT